MLTFSASPPNAVSMSRPCGIVVSAHVSARERKPACLPVITVSVFKRSRVVRASRSRRVTMNTSPASSWSSKRRSCGRSVLSPRAISQNTFSGPFRRNAATCAATLYPSVETRA